MLTMTEQAKDVVKEMVNAGGAPEGSGIRIASEPGAGGAEGLSLAIAEQPAEGDQVVEEDGSRVFLEPRAASMLDDKVLDAQRHDDHVHFSVAKQGAEGGVDGTTGAP
jgi:Fe-S cluster assembly iron-binding protein IscA